MTSERIDQRAGGSVDARYRLMQSHVPIPMGRARRVKEARPPQAVAGDGHAASNLSTVIGSERTRLPVA